MAKWAEQASNILTLNGYQSQAATTAIYPSAKALEYLSLGLASEAGEVCGKLAKWYRKDSSVSFTSNWDSFPHEEVLDELGDVLWFISEMARYLGADLSAVANNNINKLASRKSRGVLQGSGDDR